MSGLPRLNCTIELASTCAGGELRCSWLCIRRAVLQLQRQQHHRQHSKTLACNMHCVWTHICTLCWATTVWTAALKTIAATAAGVSCQHKIFNGMLSLQAVNNGQVGIAQNQCSGNTISNNTLISNMFEGITADNQANGAQVNCHSHAFDQLGLACNHSCSSSSDRTNIDLLIAWLLVNTDTLMQSSDCTGHHAVRRTEIQYETFMCCCIDCNWNDCREPDFF